MSRRISRRRVLGEAAIGAALLAGCGAGRGNRITGSTLTSTWADPLGTGQLQTGPGERLVARTELGRRAPARATLATLAHITDAHVLDASSPARVTFLNRLGAPFQSTFRPHETLTAQVLAGAVNAVAALRPDAVIQGGDLIDNDQSNELATALAVLRDGTVRPGSGRDGYFGVQLPQNPDPFYYRPDLDAPQYPGLLRHAAGHFRARGIRAPVHPVLGDHDILVAGEIVPTPVTQALALGAEAVWELPSGLALPPGVSLNLGRGYSPDGPLDPSLVNLLLTRALAGPKVRVPADAGRRQMDAPEVVGRLAPRAHTDRLDYVADVGRQVRLIVLDLARRGGGSGGLVDQSQPAWVESQLAAAGARWVILVSHQPLASSEGGEQILAVLDRHHLVVAALAGHVHRNSITPRSSRAGGYWLIETSSLIDYPQQARAIKLIATEGGGVALQTWMLDHNFPGELGRISRQLAYLDAQGGRPHGFAGAPGDRNVMLYRAP